MKQVSTCVEPGFATVGSGPESSQRPRRLFGALRVFALIATGVAAVGIESVADAAQSVTYTYDALGRLTNVSVTGGPGSGTSQAYSYDAVGNRLSQSVAAPGHTAVSLSVPTATENIMPTGGVELTVNVSGSTPGGTVTFTENGVFLGIVTVSGGQATIILESFPTGSHSIRATYSGDGTYAPTVTTFSITVRDLRWLPAVLQLLLGN